MVTIQFTQDFATRKKGDIWTCDGMLAAQLIGGDKVARVYQPEGEAKTEGTKAPATPPPAKVKKK